MRDRVDGGIICYKITMLTATSHRLRVPGPSFIGLHSGTSGIVVGIAM